jgi:hypothetical protein
MNLNGSVPTGATKIGTAKVRGLILFDRDVSVDKDIY